VAGAEDVSVAGGGGVERAVVRHPGIAKTNMKTAAWTATTTPKIFRIFIGRIWVKKELILANN
jgi:hypothetical protein